MPLETQARRLAAIVATDMVGYSRLMQRDEAKDIKHIANVYSFGIFNSQFRRVAD